MVFRLGHGKIAAMSMPFFVPRGGRFRLPELPGGQVVSSYDRYTDAKRAVGLLARAGFPVQNLAIVGSALRSVERVTGRLSYGRVAFSGAGSGAYLGLFMGVVLFVFQPERGSVLGVFVAAIVVGAGFGMLFAVLVYAFRRGRPEFSSFMQLSAGRYELLALPEFVQPARELLVRAAGAARVDDGVGGGGGSSVGGAGGGV